MSKKSQRGGQRPYQARAIRAEAYRPSAAAQARLEELRTLPVVDDELTDADQQWIDQQLGIEQAGLTLDGHIAGRGPNRAQRRAAPAEQQIDVTVTWGGRDWRVHVDKDNLSVDLLEWFEEGKTTLALRELLGAQQWVQFKALQPGHKGLNEMFELLAESLGFTSAGES